MVLSFIIYNLILKEQIVPEVKKSINYLFKSKVFIQIQKTIRKDKYKL